MAPQLEPQQNALLPAILYGTAWKEQRTAALVELALLAGFRGIDTANQRRHYFEKGVGEGIAAACRADIVTRSDLFLQTKFTYRRGQDHRLPYDSAADLGSQVAQSLAGSLANLQTDRVDSYLLHGPAGSTGWTDDDIQVWAAMENERNAGHTRLLGISNISAHQLKAMIKANAMPSFVQNRCYADRGWDREVRKLCGEHQIVYQGFSLLTANPQVLSHRLVTTIAQRRNITPAQIVFSFARTAGILPLTGTSNLQHMKQDLATGDLTLSADEVRTIEQLTSLPG